MVDSMDSGDHRWEEGQPAEPSMQFSTAPKKSSSKPNASLTTIQPMPSRSCTEHSAELMDINVGNSTSMQIQSHRHCLLDSESVLSDRGGSQSELCNATIPHVSCLQ